MKRSPLLLCMMEKEKCIFCGTCLDVNNKRFVACLSGPQHCVYDVPVCAGLGWAVHKRGNQAQDS